MKRLLVLGSTGIRITTAGVREPPRPGGTKRGPARPGAHRSAAAGLPRGGAAGRRGAAGALPAGGSGSGSRGPRRLAPSRQIPVLGGAARGERRGGAAPPARLRGASPEASLRSRPPRPGKGGAEPRHSHVAAGCARLQAGPLRRAAPKPAPQCQPRRPVPYLLPAPGGRAAPEGRGAAPMGQPRGASSPPARRLLGGAGAWSHGKGAVTPPRGRGLPRGGRVPAEPRPTGPAGCTSGPRQLLAAAAAGAFWGAVGPGWGRRRRRARVARQGARPVPLPAAERSRCRRPRPPARLCHRGTGGAEAAPLGPAGSRRGAARPANRAASRGSPASVFRPPKAGSRPSLGRSRGARGARRPRTFCGGCGSGHGRRPRPESLARKLVAKRPVLQEQNEGVGLSAAARGNAAPRGEPRRGRAGGSGGGARRGLLCPGARLGRGGDELRAPRSGPSGAGGGSAASRRFGAGTARRGWRRSAAGPAPRWEQHGFP